MASPVCVCRTVNVVDKLLLQRYIRKQNEMGFDEFEQRFSDIPYTKVTNSQPPPSEKVSDDWFTKGPYSLHNSTQLNWTVELS